MIRGNLLVALISFLLIVNVSAVSSATFTMINKCNQTVWTAIVSLSYTSLDTTGFPLQKDESRNLTIPSKWTGRLWGRTHCSSNSTGNLSCRSGDCGSGKVECSGGGATPLTATLAEFSLNALSGLDYYDVSFVNGFNLPMLVVPKGGKSGNCSATGCVVNLTEVCPNELKVTSQDGSKVACKSACQAFGGDPQYCCTGNTNSCKPSIYSEFFKKSCPRAYSYALDDDATSTFSCASANYVITFCPPLSTIKRGTKTPEAASGGKSPEVVGVSSSSPQRVSWVQFLGGVVSLYILLSTSSHGLHGDSNFFSLFCGVWVGNYELKAMNYGELDEECLETSFWEVSASFE